MSTVEVRGFSFTYNDKEKRLDILDKVKAKVGEISIDSKNTRDKEEEIISKIVMNEQFNEINGVVKTPITINSEIKEKEEKEEKRKIEEPEEPEDELLQW